MTNAIPTGATSVFLHSPQQERLRDGRRLPRFCYICPDGAKSGYTKEIVIGLPNTEAKIADYQKEFPDARIVGYGTADTQKLTLPLPTMAFAAPR